MKLKVMKTLILTFCVLAIATGGVGCKKDKGGKSGKGKRSTPAAQRGEAKARGGPGKRTDRGKKVENADRRAKQEAQAIRDKLAEKAKRNRTSSEPATTIGGMGQSPKRVPVRSRPEPRVHRKWEERQFTVDAADQSKAQAQPGLADALTHSMGSSESQLVVTYRYAGEEASQVSLIMLNVTGAVDGKLEGTVVRKNSGGAEVPVQEGDSLSVAQADVIDWTLQIGEKAYGQFLRQAILKSLITSEGDEDGELAAKLVELQADLPE